MKKVIVLLGLLAPALVHGQLFTKVTTGHIVTTPSGSRSANFLDFNRDDYQDILITNGKQGGEDDFLYLNAHDGTFTFMAGDTVCHDEDPSDGATCADYDNDGFVDVYVSNWYGVDNLLYRNDGMGGFVRIDTGIVPNDGGYSETAAWGDMDGDGLVDLYVANSAGTLRNFLYRNLGGGAFEKVTTLVPATEQYKSRCVNWIDVDRDGDQDLFVANEGTQRNNFYRNDGYPVFTKVTADPIVLDNFSSHSSSWADYDNDGDFDLLVANYDHAEQLFDNDGTGQFTEVANPFGGDVGCSFSSSFADYDNDGDLDLFVTNGYCTSYTHNYLYDNDGNGGFTRNMTEPMAVDSGSSYGCAWGDTDNDGFLELVVANWRNEVEVNSLYHNNGNGNHWLELKLEGVASNRSAIGAIVRCKVVINGSPVWMMREVSAQSGYCSQNMLVVHFGLGNAAVVDSLSVIWPSGLEQVFAGVGRDSLYGLVEGGALGVVGVEDGSGRGGVDVKVWPNPSGGAFVVEAAGVDNGEVGVTVMDGMGRVVWMAVADGVLGAVRVPVLLEGAGGMYLVRVSDGFGVHYQRVVVGK